MAVADLALRPRKGKIQGLALHRQVDHPERAAHQVRLPVLLENRHELVLADVVNLDVVVAAVPAQKGVTDPAADKERATPRPADIADDLQKLPRELRGVRFAGKCRNGDHGFHYQ